MPKLRQREMAELEKMYDSYFQDVTKAVYELTDSKIAELFGLTEEELEFTSNNITV